MKRKLLISIVLSLAVAAAMAQTNYYPNSSGTLTMNGYIYKYRNAKIANVETPDRLELYNAINPYLNTEWGYSNGTQMPFEVAMGRVKGIDDSSQTIAQTLALVDGLFTQQQKTMLLGHSMRISLRINPSTGTITDIYFKFFRNSPFVYIPIETYRSIELALKQNLTVTVTPEGKKWKYVSLNWSQKF